MYNYMLHPTAQKEYETSIKWYAKRSEQATRIFILNVEKTVCSHINLETSTKTSMN